MKLMRSRFRLISLLLTAGLLLSLGFCAASFIRQSALPEPPDASVSDDPSLPVSQSPWLTLPATSESSPANEPLPSDASLPASASPEAENLPEELPPQPDSEYNVFGL